MNKLPIIKICQSQPELALRIAQPGCSGDQVVDATQIRMLLENPHCGCVLKTPWVKKGCWIYEPRDKCHAVSDPDPPLFMFPAMHTNEYGEIVFRIDPRTFEMLRPGRYIGHIMWQNGVTIGKVDIDLCNTPFVIDRVRVHGKDADAGTC